MPSAGIPLGPGSVCGCASSDRTRIAKSITECVVGQAIRDLTAVDANNLKLRNLLDDMGLNLARDPEQDHRCTSGENARRLRALQRH